MAKYTCYTGKGKGGEKTDLELYFKDSVYLTLPFS